MVTSRAQQGSSVATAKADVFQKNGFNVGRKFAKVMKILDKIDDVKSPDWLGQSSNWE